MKKTVYFFATVIIALLAAACSSEKAGQSVDDQISDALSVDEILASPDKYVGDTIVVDGVCSHLCKHGGRKAFLQGNADNVQIRCEAFPLMGEPFPSDAIHQPMLVKGVFQEQRIDNELIAQMEENFDQRIGQIAEEYGEESAKAAESASLGCDTERAAQGQQDLNTFKERMDDYRKRIAERQEKEGKAYLSFYYIDAISFEILEQ